MPGYVRQDSGNNIDNGKTIDATYLDAEFDALAAAFGVSNGHRHDGTTGGGAGVTALGPSQDFIATSTLLRPKTTAVYDLGSDSFRFKDGYFNSVVRSAAFRGTSSIGAAFIAPSTIVGPSNGHYTWDGNTNTSMYRPAPNIIAFSSNGEEKLRITTTGVIITGTLTVSEGASIAADTAVSLTNSRNFTLTGAATSNTVGFNGTANVSLNVSSLSATALSGIVPNANISGTYTNLIGVGVLNAGSISSGFGNINIGSSTFTGNGSGLTTLNGSNISSGTVAAARLAASGSTGADSWWTAYTLNINGGTDIGAFAMLKNISASGVSYGDTLSSFDIRYSDADGGAGSAPTGIWKCLGRAPANGVSLFQRTS